MKKILAGLLGIAGTVVTQPSCATTPLIPHTKEVTLSQKINAYERNIKVESHQGETPYTVILMKDVHKSADSSYSFGCQMEMYKTLEFLGDDIDILVREGRAGLVESDNPRYYGTKYAMLRNRIGKKVERDAKDNAIMSYKEFVDLPKEKRLEWRDYFISSLDKYPVYDYGWSEHYDTPLMADALYEAIHQEEVLTLGSETIEMNKRASKIQGRHWGGPYARHVILDQREKQWTKILKNMGTSTQSKGYFVLQAGFMHFPKIEERFRNEGLSYVTLTHPPCDFSMTK